MHIFWSRWNFIWAIICSNVWLQIPEHEMALPHISHCFEMKKYGVRPTLQVQDGVHCQVVFTENTLSRGAYFSPSVGGSCTSPMPLVHDHVHSCITLCRCSFWPTWTCSNPCSAILFHSVSAKVALSCRGLFFWLMEG